MSTPPDLLSKLLLPALTLVSGVLMAVAQKKAELLSNRHLLLLIAVYSLLLAGAGFFGLIDLWFMPTYYGLAQGAGLLLGIHYVQQLRRDLDTELLRSRGYVLLLTLLILLLGGWGFSLLFDYTGTLDYGRRAATCLLPFAVPLLFYWAYEALVAIPGEIYKVWHYPAGAPEVPMDGLDYYRLMILEVRVRKDPDAPGQAINVKARATREMTFGDWFQKFIDDYNYKFPNEPIRTTGPASQPYGWMFYALRPGPFRWRRAVDFDRTIAENRLNENDTIVAKRVESVTG